MKKRINPELFRSYIYFNFLNYNNVINNKNINSLFIWQDLEIKNYLTDFLKKYKLKILNLNITRAFNMLNIQLHYIPLFATKRNKTINFCVKLLSRLNFLKMEQISKLDNIINKLDNKLNHFKFKNENKISKKINNNFFKLVDFSKLLMKYKKFNFDEAKSLIVRKVPDFSNSNILANKKQMNTVLYSLYKTKKKALRNIYFIKKLKSIAKKVSFKVKKINKDIVKFYRFLMPKKAFQINNTKVVKSKSKYYQKILDNKKEQKQKELNLLNLLKNKVNNKVLNKNNISQPFIDKKEKKNVKNK